MPTDPLSLPTRFPVLQVTAHRSLCGPPVPVTCRLPPLTRLTLLSIFATDSSSGSDGPSGTCTLGGTGACANVLVGPQPVVDEVEALFLMLLRQQVADAGLPPMPVRATSQAGSSGGLNEAYVNDDDLDCQGEQRDSVSTWMSSFSNIVQPPGGPVHAAGQVAAEAESRCPPGCGAPCTANNRRAVHLDLWFGRRGSASSVTTTTATASPVSAQHDCRSVEEGGKPGVSVERAVLTSAWELPSSGGSPSPGTAQVPPSFDFSTGSMPAFHSAPLLGALASSAATHPDSLASPAVALSGSERGPGSAGTQPTCAPCASCNTVLPAPWDAPPEYLPMYVRTWAGPFQAMLRDLGYLLLCGPLEFSCGDTQWDRVTYCRWVAVLQAGACVCGCACMRDACRCACIRGAHRWRFGCSLRGV